MPKVSISAPQFSFYPPHVYTILSEHTGQPYKTIEADGDRDFWMTSEEALKYGMIDEILNGKKKQ